MHEKMHKLGKIQEYTEHPPSRRARPCVWCVCVRVSTRCAKRGVEAQCTHTKPVSAATSCIPQMTRTRITVSTMAPAQVREGRTRHARDRTGRARARGNEGELMTVGATEE